MTDFQAYVFMVILISFGLILAMVLTTRRADWEAPKRKRDMSSQAILDRLNADMRERMANQDKALEERLNRERQEETQSISTPPQSDSYSIVSAWLEDSTQQLDTEALEASLEDDDLPDTSPPESTAVLQAIQHLEDLEG